MEQSETAVCPFCGQGNELVVDPSLPTQRMTTDCEVCCHPFEVLIECADGEIRSLAVVSA